MIVVISVLGSIGFGVMDTRVSWWQYPISVFGGMLLTMTPILWHLLCRAIVSAAKTLALEVEQVWH
jgi:hypothetical protein